MYVCIVFFLLFCGRHLLLLVSMHTCSDGSEGMADGSCPKRTESKPMDSKAQSLVLLNFFTSNPSQSWACSNNSAPLISRLNACYHASAKRWPNYIAVDFYMVLHVY
jgi:hypothetical protein